MPEPLSSDAERTQITELLQRWSAGEDGALADLLPQVYGELRRIAGAHLRRERPGHTLPPTAVVHEVYLQLAADPGIEWRSRSHFFGIAARLMRRFLIDHGRWRNAAKRGGRARPLSLDEVAEQPMRSPAELVALDEALTDLAALDPEAAKVVELRFFGGLTGHEAAAYLGVSEKTVGRHWRRARAWLYRQLERKAGDAQ